MNIRLTMYEGKTQRRTELVMAPATIRPRSGEFGSNSHALNPVAVGQAIMRSVTTTDECQGRTYLAVHRLDSRFLYLYLSSTHAREAVSSLARCAVIGVVL